MTETVPPAGCGEEQGQTRRDFLLLTTGAMAAVATVASAWTLVDSMNPAADTLALGSVDVDLAPVKEGQAITVVWRGKPIFVRHRTPAEIQAARAVPLSDLRDPQTDEQRVKPDHDAMLVVIGICTHLGCVPLGQKPSDNRGDYGGWFCPCHGSQYDTAGRIRKGPAPRNLDLPPYTYLDPTKIRLG